jgi:hypothetical protein
MSKKLLVIGLVVLFAIGTLFAVACGGDDEAAKQTMRDALTVVEADIAQMTAAFSSGQATGADLKAAIAEVEPHWLAVIAACEGVEGADATKAQQVWDDVKAAVEALPDDAGLAEMAAVLGPVQALQAYEQELRALVGGGEDATATTTAAE